MTNLRADAPALTLWLWMFIAGVEIGPSMATFTVAVQNAVPVAEMGAATSDLTLFRQIGGTGGLTFAFTLFRVFLSWDAIRAGMIEAGAPAQLLPTAPPAGFDASQLINVAAPGSGPPQPDPGSAPAGLHQWLPPRVQRGARRQHVARRRRTDCGVTQRGPAARSGASVRTSASRRVVRGA
jgi:hypothetical protein